MSFAFALLLSAFAAPAHARDTGFLDRTLVLEGQNHRYMVFVPRTWSVDHRWPVILFLHGLGESGRDGRRQSEIGLPSAIRRGQAPDSAIVVMPQAREGERWFAERPTHVALAALDSAIAEFEGDTTHVYLTGLSMGGQGAWWIASRTGQRFAAIVPICGRLFVPASGDPGSIFPAPHDGEAARDAYAAFARSLPKVPTWVFHGAEDTVVPVDESRSIVAALRTLGGDVRYTEYSGIGHGAWERAYAEPQFWEWLFTQRRAPR